MPPLTGVAVYPAGSPVQITVEPAMVTEGVKLFVISTTIALEVEVVGEAQGAFDVNIHVTTSASFNVLDVNVAVVPTALPFTNH